MLVLCPKCNHLTSRQLFHLPEDICLVCQGKLTSDELEAYRKDSHQRFCNSVYIRGI